jgi:hypothetical protein
MSYRQLAAIYLVSTACFVCVCWLWVAIGQAEDAAVTVEIASTPPLERLRPNTDLARLTLTAWLHGKPLGQGHVKVQLTAPPRTKVLATGFPRVEGTALLALDSELRDGTFTLQYLFPIRGTYTLDLDLAPVPGGPAFLPTSLRQTVRIYENPVVIRNAWLLIIGLFVLGGITGVIFARSAAARERLLTRAIVGPLVLLYGALAPVSTVSADAGHTKIATGVAQGHQVSRGDDGWELEVRSNPVPATVGHLVQLAIWLRKDGEVFPGMTEVVIEVANQEEAQAVVGTHIRARQGHTSQSLQLYDGAPHTATITVRPVVGAESGVAPLTAVLGLDVVALHPPMAVQIRMLALLLGVLVGGMVVGFCVPWASKEQAGA